MDSLTAATIEDFGNQWTRFTDNSGYYGSVDLLRDILAEVVDLKELTDTRVAEIGSGSGRIVSMLLAAGSKSVIAVEPSNAFDVLKQNTAPMADRIEYVRGPGEQLPPKRELDFVFSIGVLHHIPDPRGSVRAAYESLKPGGDMVVWLYGLGGVHSWEPLLRAIHHRT